jgi:hypothetical protein
MLDRLQAVFLRVEGAALFVGLWLAHIGVDRAVG